MLILQPLEITIDRQIWVLANEMISLWLMVIMDSLQMWPAIIDKGTPFVSPASWITDTDDICVHDKQVETSDPSSGVTGAHINNDMFQANIQAITDSHKWIEIDKECGFICTLGPYCN